MDYSEIILIAFILLVVFTGVQIKKFCDFLKGHFSCGGDKLVGPKTVFSSPLSAKPVEDEKVGTVKAEKVTTRASIKNTSAQITKKKGSPKKETVKKKSFLP